jgi:hypothetical protein
MASPIYKTIVTLVLSIICFSDIHPFTISNATQFVLSIDTGSDLEILGPGKNLTINNLKFSGKILSKKDPTTGKYIEIGVPFELELPQSPDWGGRKPVIIAPPNSTKLLARRFVQ